MRDTTGARCADRRLVPDPDLFFPISTTAPSALAQTERAKAICRGCPITLECLSLALDGGPHSAYGVWGALAEDERAALARVRSRGAA